MYFLVCKMRQTNSAYSSFRCVKAKLILEWKVFRCLDQFIFNSVEKAVSSQGAFYSFGNMSTYMTSYMRQNGSPNVTYTGKKKII